MAYAEARDNPKIKAFLDEIAAVCKKHGLSIAHEDEHGAFVIEKYEDFNIGWLESALTKIPAPGTKPKRTF